MEEEKPGDVTIDLFAALDMESEAVMERLHELSSNQKLGLLRGFLQINDWYIFILTLLNTAFYRIIRAVDIMSIIFIASGLYVFFG